MATIHKAARLSPVQWLDLLRAAIELAYANRRLGAVRVSELALSLSGPDAQGAPLSLAQHALVSRVAFAVPRMGSRVPWRSDCLVQAMAAQRWLASVGLASELFIGARHDGAESIAAHAWLKVGAIVVTGGDISPYLQFTTAKDSDPQQT
ncbi:MAG: lasso peptide biosynthesis B2 protein [Novosphingobium sp.]